MNKKQLLEAVELMRAVYSEEALTVAAVRQFVDRGLTLCGPSEPIEDHILAIAASDTVPKYRIWRALAAHHPNQFVRWWYKQRYEHSLLLIISTAMFWVSIALVSAPVVLLILNSPRLN